MNKAEYRDYIARFRAGMEGLWNLSSGTMLRTCKECAPDFEYVHDLNYGDDPEVKYVESHFSYSTCEVCRSDLGGDRTIAHAWSDAQLVHLTLCADCVYFNEYGRLDDRTMAEIEASED